MLASGIDCIGSHSMGKASESGRVSRFKGSNY